jgi:hypothetical protein
MEAITPAAIEATRLSVEQPQIQPRFSSISMAFGTVRTRYEVERAERRYRTEEPENRLVARGLETEWENRLRSLTAAASTVRGTFMNQGSVGSGIQKFLEVQVQHPAIAFSYMLLRLYHRLMRRASGPKPVAVIGKRSVPFALQY